jgi:hypothetical protein
MAVLKGLKTLVNTSPNFSNQGVQNGITNCNTGFISKTRTLLSKTDVNEVLTNSQKNSIKDAINTNTYLNVKYLDELDAHTVKILDGSLGEQDPDDDRPNTGTFLQHLSEVQGFILTIPTLYGVTADSMNRGINGHFGSIAGYLDNTLETLTRTMTFINQQIMSTDTAYQTALQNMSDLIDTLEDSTDLNVSTFNSLVSSIISTSANFHNNLSTGIYTEYYNNLVSVKNTIETQIALETSNLGSIFTYSESLTTHNIYQSFASDKTIAQLLSRLSQNADWKKYFDEYETNSSYDNALYHNPASDSSANEIIESVMRLRGLPDVVDYTDIRSVTRKALKDVRIKDKISDSGKTAEQIINDSLNILGLSVPGSVYAKSKVLLENMNNNDVEIIKKELALFQDVNTLS